MSHGDEVKASIRARVIYVVALTSVLIWLGLIMAAPWLMATHHYAIAFLLYKSFSALCHQLPDRSFHLLGFPLTVCARCTGIYAGFLIGLLCYPFVRRLEDEVMPARLWLMVTFVPVVIDFAGGAIGIFTNTFFSRTTTGAIAGAAAAFYILPGLMAVRWRLPRARSRVKIHYSRSTT